MGSGAQSRPVCGFGLFCAGYDGSSASRPTNAYVTHPLVWPIDEEGEGLGINRWSDMEERKRNETDAKADGELHPRQEGRRRLQASVGFKKNAEKREVVEKLKERES